MSQIFIRKIYLYLFSLIGLVLITIGGVQLVGLFLKTYIFTKADVYYEYPMARPVKPAPIDSVAKEEVQQSDKEEVEKFQNDQRSANRQRDAAGALAMIIVGSPLYWYHWSVIKKGKEDNQ